jgi:hypothetical protein
MAGMAADAAQWSKTCRSGRNYSGSIEANIEDDCLYGEIRFIRALVSYEAPTVSLANHLAQYG